MLSSIQFELGRVIEWTEWRHECLPRLKYASKLEMKHLPQLEPHDGKCVIVGAGPSAENYIDKIRALKADGQHLLMTVNAMHGWALGHGIIPHIQVVFEHDIEDVRASLGGNPHPEVTYYITSFCSQKVFRQLSKFNRVLWHAFCPPHGYQKAIARYFPGEFMVAGGYCTFFRAVTIATILGYRNFDLFGVDSSFEESSHIEGYALADIEERITVYARDSQSKELRQFTTQGGLAFQATEFMKFCEINQPGLRLRIHGDGLLRFMHETRYPEQYQ